MIKVKYFTLLLTVLTFGSCLNSFEINTTNEGVEISEGGKKVLFFQKKEKSKNGKYARSCYIHPLYDLEGKVLTEDFPEDHPHHRGVFWAWHQVYKGKKNLGDQWLCKSVKRKCVDIKAVTHDNYVTIETLIKWSSNKIKGDFLQEKCKIKIHKKQSGVRKIDFEISLKALMDSLYLGGDKSKKGYGGFSVRLRLPENIKFNGENGVVKPQKHLLKDGSVMTFTGDFTRSGDSSLSLICNEENPNSPHPWILRKKGSMQNVVWPGRELTRISKDKPLILKYRLVIHNETKFNKDWLRW